MKALVVDEPWIGMILDGAKTWEMWSKVTRQRGPIALIRKGSGQVVGIATLTDCAAPITAESYAAAEDRHRIPPARQPWAIANGYVVPWVLEDASALMQPVPYRHPSGAVTWVVLEESVAQAVMNAGPTSSRADSGEPTPRPMPTQADTRTVALTAGNIGNGHIYLRSILDFFPESAIGGSDRTQRANRLLVVTFDSIGPHETDFTGPDRLMRPGRSNHCFFRERAPVRRFFALHGAEDGDAGDITRTGPQAYTETFRARSRAA